MLPQLTALVAAAALPLAAAQKLTVNVGTKYQVIDGFGFSEAFQRAYNIYNLPEPKRSQLVDLLFNATTGAGFTILRNGIGSSKTSQNDWMNTFLVNKPSSPSAAPTYTWDAKDSGQLWVSQQAVKYGVNTFYGNSWSPPGFMKDNNDDANGGQLCGAPGVSCSSGDWRQAFANYLVKYVQLYAESGVNVTHIGFLNEPDYKASYASMLMSPAQAVDFVKVLYPTLQKAGLAWVQIVCCETTGWSKQMEYSRALQSGAPNMNVVASGHTYSSPITQTQPFSGKVWQTEASDLSGKWSTAWYTSGASGDGYTWANAVWQGLTQGNLNAYLWWVGTQDPATNNDNNEKLIRVEATTYQVSKRFWAFAQYSRTVRPGAYRVSVSDSGSLRTTAFLNTDGRVAVNIINTGTGNAQVSIGGLMAKSAVGWLTDNNNDMTAINATVASDGTVSGLTLGGRAMGSYLIQT